MIKIIDKLSKRRKNNLIFILLLNNLTFFSQIKSEDSVLYASKVKVKHLNMAYELPNGNFSGFAFDGCDGILRNRGFIIFDSLLNFFENYKKGFYEFIDDSNIDEKLFIEKNKFSFQRKDSLLKKIIINDMGNVLIVKNSKFIKKNECLSDGFFFYVVFKMKIKYIEYKFDQVTFPDFYYKQKSGTKYLTVDTHRYLILDILEIEPVLLNKKQRFININ